jgi:hypothetical protein
MWMSQTLMFMQAYHWYGLPLWNSIQQIGLCANLEFNNIFHKTLLIFKNFTKLICEVCEGSQLKSGRNFIIIGLVCGINGLTI